MKPLAWRTACAANGSCVQIAYRPRTPIVWWGVPGYNAARVLLRDSTNPAGPVIALLPHQWITLTHKIKENS